MADSAKEKYRAVANELLLGGGLRKLRVVNGLSMGWDVPLWDYVGITEQKHICTDYDRLKLVFLD